MISGLCSMNIYQVLLLILVLLQAMMSDAEPSNQQCIASSCSDVRNISCPFRLQSDPKGCGDLYCNLTCEDNRTFLYVFAGRFYVKSIDYSAQAITLIDEGLQKGNCSSLPHRSWAWNDYEDAFSQVSLSGWTINNSSAWVIVNCSKPVDSPFYIDAGPCIEGSYSSATSSNWSLYVLFNPRASDVGEFCTINVRAMTSHFYEQVNSSSHNYEQIHNIMADGVTAYLNEYSPLRRTYSCHFVWWALSRLFQYFRLSDIYHYYGPICRRDWVVEVEPYTSVGARIAEWIIGDFILPLVLFCVGKFVIGAPFVTIFLIYKYRRRHLAMDKNIEEFLQANNNFMPIRYSYSNIKKITRNFKHKLGEGGYGSVYKGTLRSGNEVAIKILKSKAHGQDFINEVITIGRIHHVNIVKLIGFVFEGTKQALVYDLMSNGSLDKHIFTKEGDKLLDYWKIYEIALGVARGIEYLHRGCDMQILHFDIKPHNILLDTNFTPKVSDFGLAKLYPTNHNIVSLTAARGTLGYMAPELYYKDIGGVSYKADVYSFGMLLMEMAGRRKNINANAERSSQIYFPLWVYDQVDEGKSAHMGEVVEEERDVIKKMIIVAFWCIQLNPDHRPSMRKVLEMLEGDIGKLQMPPRPHIYPPDVPANNDKSEQELETFSTSSSALTTFAGFPFRDTNDV